MAQAPTHPRGTVPHGEQDPEQVPGAGVPQKPPAGWGDLVASRHGDVVPLGAPAGVGQRELPGEPAAARAPRAAYARPAHQEQKMRCVRLNLNNVAAGKEAEWNGAGNS